VSHIYNVEYKINQKVLAHVCWKRYLCWNRYFYWTYNWRHTFYT